jgi:hypothetical protein
MSIAAFVAERMSSYIAGGMEPATAARFTRGELLAIYKGNHRSRNNSGTMQITPPPEVLDIETAMTKCDAAIMGILKTRTGRTAQPRKDRTLFAEARRH